MKKNVLVSVVLALVLVAMAVPAFAIEPTAIKESQGWENPAGAPAPCALTPSSNGTCGNYRWYNTCSGYIWIFSGFPAGDEMGTKFGGAPQPCVAAGNTAKRVIYYFRNVAPGYGQTVDVFLHSDVTGDGCRDGLLGQVQNLDPAMAWNCIDYNVCIPGDYVIGSIRHDGGAAPTIVTDGDHYGSTCDLPGNQRSYYYGVNNATCEPWVGPSPVGRNDNFLMWLIVDTGCASNSTEPTSWGNIKGLYQ
jgi:hypothetical protein